MDYARILLTQSAVRFKQLLQGNWRIRPDVERHVDTRIDEIRDHMDKRFDDVEDLLRETRG